jgi:hypothetical protein
LSAILIAQAPPVPTFWMQQMVLSKILISILLNNLSFLSFVREQRGSPQQQRLQVFEIHLALM